jgi:hypothetical protein
MVVVEKAELRKAKERKVRSSFESVSDVEHKLAAIDCHVISNLGTSQPDYYRSTLDSGT